MNSVIETTLTFSVILKVAFLSIYVFVCYRYVVSRLSKTEKKEAGAGVNPLEKILRKQPSN